MRHLKKRYETPVKAWQKERITLEQKMMRDHGLKNKKEIWKAEGLLRKFRREARKLTASMEEKQRKEFVEKLNSLGLVGEKASLDDVLELELSDILNRRLQTFIYKKGLADTIKEARQLITHGHVYVNNKKLSVPGYLVRKKEENELKKL